MIRRIKKIENVGCFTMTSASSISLGRVTIIYGRNGYGKSTLADVFRSLATNEPKVLADRRSIIDASVQGTQRIELTLQEGTEKEEPLEFKNSWNPQSLPFKIEVFDAQFVHDNVFAGLDLNRDNKENLNSILLGEESVRLGNEIQELERLKHADKREEDSVLDELRRSVLGLDETFLNSIPEDETMLSSQIDSKSELCKHMQEGLAKKDTIMSFTIPFELSIPLTTEGFIEELVSALSSTYSEFSSSALESFRAHITKCFGHKDGNESSWIRVGIGYISDDSNAPSCPFCGKELGDDSLLSVYRKYFDERFIQYSSNIKRRLTQFSPSLTAILTAAGRNESLVTDNLVRVLRFQPYMYPGFQGLASTLEGKGDQIIAAITRLLEAGGILRRETEPIIALKLNEEFSHLDGPESIKHFADESRNFEIQVKEYNATLSEINTVLNAFRDSMQAGDISSQTAELQTELDLLNRRLLRTKLAERIEALRKLRSSQAECSKTIKAKQDELVNSSKTFCDQYFKDVQKIFAEFDTSNAFKIQTKKLDTKGYKPVYGFEVLFRGKKIAEKSLSKVFSDGDRRSLALAIFLARLEQSKDISNVVLILDDVGTSLDDDRRTALLSRIRGLLNRGVQQLIILSHNRQFLPELLRSLADESPVVLEISRTSTSNKFEEIEDWKLHFGPYARRLGDVLKFADGDALDPDTIRKHLRILPQVELEYRFAPHLLKKKFQGPGAIIDFLHSAEIIQDDFANALRDIVAGVTDDMHHVRDNETEDTRLLANKYIRTMYPNLDKVSS